MTSCVRVVYTVLAGTQKVFVQVFLGAVTVLRTMLTPSLAVTIGVIVVEVINVVVPVTVMVGA